MTQTTKEKIKKTAELLVKPLGYLYIFVAFFLITIGMPDPDGKALEVAVWMITIPVAVCIALCILFLFAVFLGFIIVSFENLLKQFKAIWKA